MTQCFKRADYFILHLSIPSCSWFQLTAISGLRRYKHYLSDFLLQLLDTAHRLIQAALSDHTVSV